MLLYQLSYRVIAYELLSESGCKYKGFILTTKPHREENSQVNFKPLKINNQGFQVSFPMYICSMKIVLIGYMASGKTAVAKELSKRTHIPAYDLDHYIEEKNQMDVATFIREKGEIKFRKEEYERLHEILQFDHFILSSGGGTPCYYDNIQQMKEGAYVVYLQWPLSVLLSRLKAERENRPLFDGVKEEDMPEYVAKHIFDRRPFYEQADHIIFGKDQSPEELATEIYDAWKNHSMI